MRMTAADIIASAVPNPTMPATFETSDGTRYTLDPDEKPYVHEGRLVVPIVEER